MRKFVLEAGWVPKKLGILYNFFEIKGKWLFWLSNHFEFFIAILDVYIDVPEIIDISNMRSKGLQPGEELLPETGNIATYYIDLNYGIRLIMTFCLFWQWNVLLLQLTRNHFVLHVNILIEILEGLS